MGNGAERNSRGEQMIFFFFFLMKSVEVLRPPCLVSPRSKLKKPSDSLSDPGQNSFPGQHGTLELSMEPESTVSDAATASTSSPVG